MCQPGQNHEYASTLEYVDQEIPDCGNGHCHAGFIDLPLMCHFGHLKRMAHSLQYDVMNLLDLPELGWETICDVVNSEAELNLLPQ